MQFLNSPKLVMLEAYFKHEDTRRKRRKREDYK